MNTMPARFNFSRRPIASVFLLINAICWGAALVIVKPALSFVSPLEYLFSRFALAALLSLPILIYYTWKQPNVWRSLSTIVWLELIGTTLTLTLVYEGLARTTALEANLIATTAPLFVVVGGVLFLKEREEKREVLGLIIALAGTLLMTFASARQTWTGILSISLLGNLLVFSQNISESGYFLLAKKRYAKIPKFFVTAVSFWIGALTFGPLSALQQGLSLPLFLSQAWDHFFIPPVFVAVTYMATFGSIIGLTAYIIGQNLVEASEASLYRYLQPLVYIPLSVLVLKEQITPLLLPSMLLIGIGVFIAEYRKKNPRRSSRQRRG